MSATTLPPGIYPYLVSPVDMDGKVNEGELRRLVDYVIDAGVHGLSPLGSTGEVMYLTAEQRLALVDCVVDAAGGRVPVVPGVAAFSTYDAAEQARRYEQAGVDGLVVMRQHALPVADRGVTEYFRTVASAVSCPVVLYTNPAVLGSDLSPASLAELTETPNIRYIKDATGNTGRILTILNHLGDRLGVFSASAHIPLFVFQLGGVGWMAGPACAAPRACVQLYDLYCAGDHKSAMAVQRRLWFLNEVFQKYSLAGCVKAALGLLGFDVGAPIAPQESLGAQATEEIQRALRIATGEDDE